MNFKIHIKYVKNVMEAGKWVRVFLKNGVIFEGPIVHWVFNPPFISYEKLER